MKWLVGAIGCALVLFLVIAAFVNGHSIGYREGFHDGVRIAGVATTVAPLSNCYMPGEAHKADTPACVVIDEGLSISTNSGVVPNK